ncbi:MAG: hypothetical protein WBM50_18875 [Acidimicrobiales bacterium]
MTETIHRFDYGGAEYELDHLGIERPETQWGEFAIYSDGSQVAEFAIEEAMLKPEFRPASLPPTSELEMLAVEALTTP